MSDAYIMTASAVFLVIVSIAGTVLGLQPLGMLRDSTEAAILAQAMAETRAQGRQVDETLGAYHDELSTIRFFIMGDRATEGPKGKRK